VGGGEGTSRRRMRDDAAASKSSLSRRQATGTQPQKRQVYGRILPVGPHNARVLVWRALGQERGGDSPFPSLHIPVNTDR